MIKVIIIDDEPLARMIIRDYLEHENDIEIITECGDGFEGAKAIQQHKPDLIFLDIQMPKLTGFEMLEIIDELPHVIFTTAFEEFAIRAFEKNTVDYLLKPISQERFSKALEKLRNIHSNQQPKQSLQQLKTDIEEETLERIVVKNGTQIKLIPAQQIIFLEAYDDYVKIHTQDGMFLKNKTMSSFEKQLDSKQFVRVHRSFIIKVDQLAKIEPMEKESYRGILLNGEKVSISKSGYARLKQTIGL
ncbi:LytR/AlgR family response regulator transcription factor [Sphingobacterium lumbrici]|uniref:LytR/AlgR family response regulator transcription factor n=1 Tax=Sphingobacterium lumbrici TaxID=2559600 RepID=UPI00112ED4A2|nr:response regulator [Sphingobacterium lumbrici]